MNLIQWSNEQALIVIIQYYKPSKKGIFTLARILKINQLMELPILKLESEIAVTDPRDLYGLGGSSGFDPLRIFPLAEPFPSNLNLWSLDTMLSSPWQ